MPFFERRHFASRPRAGQKESERFHEEQKNIQKNSGIGALRRVCAFRRVLRRRPDHDQQRKGYGTQLIKFLLEHYKDRYQTMLVGTGDSTYTIPFYERCGFTYSHRIPDFFIKNYDHPMYEDGKQLRDMVYLKISKK